MKLLQELFAQDIISEEKMKELDDQIKKSGKTEEEIILAKNIVSEDFLFNLKSKSLNLPLERIDAEKILPEVFKMVPEEACINYKMAAVEKTGNSVKIGMVYPEDIAAQNVLRFLGSQENFTYKSCLITPGNLVKILKQYEKILIEGLGGEKEEVKKEEKKEKASTVQDLIELGESSPAVTTLDNIISTAIEKNASDIHIEPSREKLKVRFRLDGILHPDMFLSTDIHLSILSRIKILSGLKIDEKRLPQDGSFSKKIDGRDIDFRVSTFPTLYGEKAEIRILDSSTAQKSFEDLGLDGRNLEVIKEAIKKPFGMILFTGPTGSGKTTTQYAILRILNQDSVNIVTVEDPIEYSIDGINQSQVKPEIGYTFASGLRQILRQDPNIIMVGEIRDEETAGLAINAALTGHIVLSTLHANSSVGVIPRLIDMGVRPFLIPSTLRVVISQRLVRILCPKCKIKIKPQEEMRKYILERIKSLPASAKTKIEIQDPLFVYDAKGCEACGSTGYSGRVGLFEVLSMSDEIADLVQNNPLESLIFKAAQKQGMLTMEQEGIIKVLNGQTTIEEVIRATEEK